MEISWQIVKPRGNYRPKLFYAVALTDAERGLGGMSGQILSTIPAIGCGEMVRPGERERASDWLPAEYIYLHWPHANWDSYELLPWRIDNQYPEVDASMQALCEAIELAIRQAYDSVALSMMRCLEMSDATKQHIAPGFAADRMLKGEEKK